MTFNESRAASLHQGNKTKRLVCSCYPVSWFVYFWETKDEERTQLSTLYHGFYSILSLVSTIFHLSFQSIISIFRWFNYWHVLLFPSLFSSSTLKMRSLFTSKTSGKSNESTVFASSEPPKPSYPTQPAMTIAGQFSFVIFVLPANSCLPIKL